MSGDIDLLLGLFWYYLRLLLFVFFICNSYKFESRLPNGARSFPERVEHQINLFRRDFSILHCLHEFVIVFKAIRHSQVVAVPSIYSDVQNNRRQVVDFLPNRYFSVQPPSGVDLLQLPSLDGKPLELQLRSNKITMRF